MNAKLYAVTDATGRPLKFFMTAGQVSDYTGAADLLSSLHEAERLLADRGNDADWYREAFAKQGYAVWYSCHPWFGRSDDLLVAVRCAFRDVASIIITDL